MLKICVINKCTVGRGRCVEKEKIKNSDFGLKKKKQQLMLQAFSTRELGRANELCIACSAPLTSQHR